MIARLLLVHLTIEQIIYLVSLGILITSALVIAMIYVGYPLFIYIAGKIFARPVRQADIFPSVSVIIAAYNEEKDLPAKIENTLSLNYPKEKLEIIVASDCSTDRTDDIVRSYADRGVILHRQSHRYGKTVAQNNAVDISTGDVLVFSDATTIYEIDALRNIVRNFADPEVGCVAGKLIYADRAVTAVGKGCRSYWEYEKFLKQCESSLGSLIGVSGCLYAMRRSCHARLAVDMIDDFVIATEIHMQGLRTIYEPNAISVESTNNRGRDEFRMRVRVIEQTMSVLSRYREVLNPFRHGMYAVQMIFHKLLRYTVPVWVVAALISGAVLALHSSFYTIVFLGQLAFFGAALLGFLGERIGLKLRLLAFPYYFVLVNAASVCGFIKFIRGEAHVVWEPLRASRSSI